MRPLACVALLVPAALGVQCGGDADAGPRSVVATRGTVRREAVAVGRLEAEFEVPVTATSGGVVTRKFVTLGQRVAQDEPLFEVRPVLTDRERLQAERALQAARESEQTASEILAGQNALGVVLRMVQGQRMLARGQAGAERARESAETSVKLLLEGQVEVDGYVLDYIVRAPTAGHVIQLDLAEGAPVVPASAFGTGTELLVLADLDRLVFRGTADEIDVGRLKVGMRARITLGALPGVALEGELTEISLKARERLNAVVFPVKIAVEAPEGLTLRSGYSAVARVEVEQAADVVTVPERVLEFRDDGVYVRVDDGDAGALRRVELGTGDGLTTEVRAGLEEGERVLERPL